MKKRNMMKDFRKIIALVVIFFCAQSIHALIDGSLDASFNGSGLSVLLDADSTIKAVAIQADGKIVAAGSSDIQGKNSFSIVRYNIDGSLDKSFGLNGQVITRFSASESNSGARAIVIQEDGKIIAAGFTNAIKNTNRWCVARYNTDGSLDESFFGGRAIFKGTVITFFGNDSLSQANALALTPDGKIVVAGMSQVGSDKTYFAVARYNNDGSLDDAGFNHDGKGAPAGTVRTTFGGVTDNDQALAVVVQPNGKIVAGGFSMLTGAKTFALARYNLDGSLDTSFFSPGFARYHGTVVTSFACGETEGSIGALVVQADGKIIAAGSTNSNSWRKDICHFALARYDNRGILDASFGGYGLATVPGTVMSSFGAHEGASRINALALQGDGKVIAGGTLSMNGASYFALTRYNTDGTVDCGFNDGVSPSGKVITSLGGRKANEIYALALANNGDIVAAGSTDLNGRPQGLLARYLTQVTLLEPAINLPANKSIVVNGSTIRINGTSQNPGILKIFVDDNLVGSCAAKGVSNTWSYQLPPLASGNHTVKVLELYAGANVSLISQPITLVIDQHPKAVNGTVSTCGLHSVCGQLQATGASGKYIFSLVSSNNGTASINGDQFCFTPSIPVGQGSFEFTATDAITQCTSNGTINVIINEIPNAIVSESSTCQDTSVNGSVAQYVSGGNAPFNFEQVGECINGTVVLNTDGTFTFTPNSGFSGVASFQYQVTDSLGCVSDPVTVNVTVYQAPVAQDATFTTHQAQLLSKSVSNAVSGGTAPYTFNLVNCPGNCALTLQPNGSFIVIPMLGFSGTLTFTYQVTDAHQCSSNVATITVTVFESPVAANALASACQNSKLFQSLTDLITKGTPPYVFSQVGTAAHGVAVVNTDGSFTFTPDADFVGQASFAYQVTDQNNSISKPATVTITVNELPKAADVSFATCQDTSVANSLAAAASGGTAPYSFALNSAATNGLLTIQDDGSFEFIPDQGFSGTSNFSYTVTDANGCTSLPAQGVISVWENPAIQDAAVQTCANRPVSDTLSQLISGGLQPYTYVSDLAENGTVTITDDGSYTFTPAQDFAGTATFEYHVVDAHQCASKTGTVSITVNPSPAVADASASTIENAPVQGNVASLASGGIAPYTFSLVGQAVNGSVTLDSDGSYQFTPALDYFGQASFTYQVADVHGCVSNAAQVVVNVFGLPKVSDSAVSAVVNAALSGSLSTQVSGGTAPYTFQKISDASHGLLVINNDGSYTYTPQSDYSGSDSFGYAVIDANQGHSNTGTVSITLYKPLAITVQKEYTTCPNSEISGTLNDVVADGQLPYSFSIANYASHGAVELQQDGSFSYSPAASFAGNDSFQYSVHDSSGNNVQGTVVITVLEGPAAADNTWNIFESGSVQDSVAGLITGGKQPYTIQAIGNATNGTVQVNPDGSFNFTPAPNFIGTAKFQYLVTDANGCASAINNATIQVLSLPKAHDGNAVGATNGSISGSLAASVSAGTPPYSFQKLSDASHGTLVINSDGSYSYTPNVDYVGADAFEYSVTDAQNGSASGQVALSIATRPVIIAGNSYPTCANNAVSGDLSGYVSDGVTPYLFSLANSSSNAQVNVTSNGTFTYTPAQGFSGNDSFQYLVTDAIGTQVQGTVAVTVNQAPTARDSSWQLRVSELNDTLVPFVSGGNPPYQFAQVGSATNGTVLVNPDGTFSFDAAIEGGIARFAYQVTDANNCVSNTGTVTINLDLPPRVRASSFTTLQDQPLSNSLVPLMVGGNAPYIFGQVGSARNGTVVLSRNGSFIFTPNQGFVGSASFDFVVTDKNGKSSAIATVSIIVNEDANKRFKNVKENSVSKRYLYGRNK